MMKQLTINPDNRRFYSDDFIKGFECGTRRQLEADKADRPQGEWILKDNVFYYGCCGKESQFTADDVYVYDMSLPNYCPNCGARMKGADDDGRNAD